MTSPALPTTTVPRDYANAVVLPGESVRCLNEDCGRVVVPDPVLTCLGDLVLRMGGWCPSCRRRCCLLEITPEVAGVVPPWKFLAYDQKMPAEGESWPRARWGLFATRDFLFGANDIRSVDAPAVAPS